jgi:two-component system, NtrC family, nitrogen regulation response regulator NtrX
VPIHVPPLRERAGDVPGLVQHFADQLTQRAGLPSRGFAPSALRRLQSREWPGNIRELRNAVERLLILAGGSEVGEADVERLVGAGAAPAAAGVGELQGDTNWLRASTFEEFKQAAERAYLLAKLKENDWNVSETARTLEMPRSNLYKKIERYRLAREA